MAYNDGNGSSNVVGIVAILIILILAVVAFFWFTKNTNLNAPSNTPNVEVNVPKPSAPSTPSAPTTPRQ